MDQDNQELDVNIIKLSIVAITKYYFYGESELIDRMHYELLNDPKKIRVFRDLKDILIMLLLTVKFIVTAI